jgi:hypothetical protein
MNNKGFTSNIGFVVKARKFVAIRWPNTGLSRPSLRWGTLSIASDSEGKANYNGAFALSMRSMERVVA